MSETKLEAIIRAVKSAQKKYAEYDQERVDHIFKQAASAANQARITLAKMAVEESGMGIVEDKVIKNHFASEYIFNKYYSTKTCGVISTDPENGITKVAEPIGVIAGIIPTTNPTSTAIFKSLIALKTRNGIVFSPHPRAKKATIEAARIVLEAAVAAGAPDDIIGWLDDPTVEDTQRLMASPDINIILATGGPGMVQAAYSSGKPALGVGAGNTPAVIDERAHIKMAVSSVLLSKTFDNGVICASEQSVIVVDAVYDAVRAEFLARGGYFLNADEKMKMDALILKKGKLNAEIVGQPAVRIAALAGIEINGDIKVLIGETDKIGADEPFAYEKLSPVLGFYRAANFKEACAKAKALVEFGGIGHTSVLYTDQDQNERTDYFGKLMKTGRILINMPASQGAIGDIYNFKLEPSLTLGCGSWGGNSVSENVGVKHLINVKTVAQRRENMLWFQVPPKIYFKKGSLDTALSEIKGKRAFIVTDKMLYDLGYADRVCKVLDAKNIDHHVFFDVKPDPTLTTAIAGAEIMRSFKPDVIIALGGGSPMDAAKIMRILYEHPGTAFDGMAMRFMDIKKRIFQFPAMDKTYFIAIPTTSGTGSEVTPFAVITDDTKGGIKYPLADYALTPDMAIIDPDFVMNVPARLTAYSGIDALTHAIEAYASVLASEYTNGLALEAIRLIFKYLPESYEKGAAATKAKEKMHYAATIAGMAFANAFLGICHSMAHKMGSMFHLAHGLANALLICEVIRFNKTDVPKKLATFPQYKYPLAKERYARIADHLALGGKDADEKVEKLIEAIEQLKKRIDIPPSIRAAGVDEVEFKAKLDELAENAFDDQCTGANPRYPFIAELKEIYLKCL